MKKNIKEYPNFSFFPKEVSDKFNETYEENIYDIVGYNQLPEDIKEMLESHLLSYTPSLGRVGNQYLSGYRCEKCGSIFIISPYISQIHTKINSPLYSLGNNLYLRGTIKKCTYEFVPN